MAAFDIYVWESPRDLDADQAEARWPSGRPRASVIAIMSWMGASPNPRAGSAPTLRPLGAIHLASVLSLREELEALVI